MSESRHPFVSFHAIAERSNGTTVPFSLSVFEPEHEDVHCYACLIDCPFLNNRPFKIFGADETQARELAISFVRNVIRGDLVAFHDEKGNEVAIPGIDSMRPDDPSEPSG